MASNLCITSTLPLPSSSHQIPRLGLGVYESHGQKCKTACLAALRAGYRHIDTAQYYANETEVGQAILESKIPRSEIFVTTKILSAAGSVEKSYQQCVESVRKIPGEYVDLFLVHSPNAGGKARKEMWLALEKLRAEGLARDIGVSNWGVGHIEEVKGWEEREGMVWPPGVNQIELHPFNQQREVVEYCHKHGIVVSAYCPLIRNQRADDPTLNSIAKAHKKSVAQVLVRYCLQKDWVPLPKSENEERIVQNGDVYDFELSGEEMKTLDGLDQGSRGAIVQAVTNSL